MQPDQPVLGMVERLGHRREDLESEVLPEVHGGQVRLDDGVELDRPVPAALGPVDELVAERPADAAALPAGIAVAM